MHSFERKLSPLSNGVSGKVVQRIGRELFDLKAGGDIFFESPCITICWFVCIAYYSINKVPHVIRTIHPVQKGPSSILPSGIDANTFSVYT